MKKLLALTAVILVVLAGVYFYKEFTIAKEAADNLESLVKLTSVEKIKELGDYNTFIAADESYSVEVALISERYIKNVSINAITFADDGNGKVTFEEEKLYTADLDKPLIVKMVFYSEVFPNMGLSYIDALGDKHSFFITQSGKDGSIRLENCDDYLANGLIY